MPAPVEFYEQYDLTKWQGWTPSVVNMLTRGNGSSLIDSYTPLSAARYTLDRMGQYLQRATARAPQVQDIIDYLYQVADRYGIRREVAYRQIERESNFDPNAVGTKGELGIAQFLESTAREYGLIDRSDPYASLDAWGRYMRDLLDRFGGDYEQALGGYNWGQGRVAQAVRRFGASWLTRAPKVTRDYIAYILGGLRDALPGGGAGQDGSQASGGSSAGCDWFDVGCHLEGFITGDTGRDLGKRIGLVVLAVVLLAVAVVSLR